MLKRSIGYLRNSFIGGGSVGFDDDRLVLALGFLQQRPELLHRDPLVLEVNRRSSPACDANDLAAGLRTERESRERHRNGDALLKDNVRAKQQEKHEQKSYVHQPDQDDPGEIKVDRAVELHNASQILDDSIAGSELCLGAHSRLRLFKADDATDRAAFR